MHVSVSLLLPLLHLCSQARAMPLPPETLKMKLRVESMAVQLRHKLEKVEIPEVLKYTPLDQPYRHDVCYMVQYLNLSSSLISSSYNKSQEIKSELASLSGFADQSGQCHCAGRPRPPVSKDLAKLQGKTRYTDSVTPRVYYLLTEYLRNLNKTQLERC